MRKYIAHLRTKPDSHRKKVAFGASAAITGLIALFWVTSFSYFNGGSTNPQVAVANTKNSPINVIRKSVAGAYEALTGTRVEFVKGQDTTTTPTLEYVPESENHN